MPGQYYDSESGLFYNQNRYYAPALGRYISSDPIGLAGGLNTFNYAFQSPLTNIDPSGLVSSELPGDEECETEGGCHVIGGGPGGFDINGVPPNTNADIITEKGVPVAAPEVPVEGKQCVAPDFVVSNPFKDKSAKEIEQMFKDKGFRESGPDPLNGKGGYVNPKTGRSYHIDPKEYGKYREPNHVDVNRPRDYKGPLDKKKFLYQE